jgi:hypothetical protein
MLKAIADGSGKVQKENRLPLVNMKSRGLILGLSNGRRAAALQKQPV